MKAHEVRIKSLRSQLQYIARATQAEAATLRWLAVDGLASDSARATHPEGRLITARRHDFLPALEKRYQIPE